MTTPLQTEKNTATIPKRLNRNTIATFYNRINHIKNTENSDKCIFIDAEELTFIDAIAMTILVNIIADLVHSEGWRTFIRNSSDGKIGELKDTISFRDDSEFFLLITNERISNEPRRIETSLPIKRLLPNETLAWINFIAIPWMARKLNVSVDDLVEIQICIQELVNNIRDHSGVEFSNIFIQFTQCFSEVKICLYDNGIGLINKIKSQKEYSELDDEEIISLALQEGFTTKSSYRNRGMGLFTLTRTVCHNGGQFSIRTGNIEALIIPSNNYSEPNIHLLRGMEYLQGTAFEITIYTSGIDKTQADKEDFLWD